MQKQTVFFSPHKDCNPRYTGKFLISTIRTAKASNKQCDLFNKESQKFKFNHKGCSDSHYRMALCSERQNNNIKNWALPFVIRKENWLNSCGKQINQHKAFWFMRGSSSSPESPSFSMTGFFFVTIAVQCANSKRSITQDQILSLCWSLISNEAAENLLLKHQD